MLTGKAQVELTSESLFIDDVLQSDRRDEYIYHEALVHPAMSNTTIAKKDVLIIGGAEGCTAREVLKWGDNVNSVTQVDWDGVLCDMFKDRADWNAGSYNNPKFKLVVADAWEFCRSATNESFDIIIVDLLDPDAGSLPAFLELLKECRRMLKPFGSLSANCGGVFPWDTVCLQAILEDEPDATPYRVFVPSFEWEWSFILWKKPGFFDIVCLMDIPPTVKDKLRFFDENAWFQMKMWSRNYLPIVTQHKFCFWPSELTLLQKK